MNEMLSQHSVLAKVQKDIRKLKVKRRPPDDDLGSHKSLLRYLPQRDTADQLVKVYIQTFESTYRVLHLPTFWSEYRTIWQAPHDARPAFVALLLIIMACTNCVAHKENEAFRGTSSMRRETACNWIEAGEEWLSRQSQKHITLTYLQAQCVLLIAKQINTVKKKRSWASAGTLMSFAISAGLHRDAEIVNRQGGSVSTQRISYFDQEMRRQLWSTISELELQAAMDRGMPSSLPDLIIDCGSVSNCDDEEIDPHMGSRPESHAITHYTTSSFQYIADSTRVFRQRVASLINGTASNLSYEEMLTYDRLVMQRLTEIPCWDRADSLASKSLIQLQLYEILILLHRPYAGCEAQTPRFNYSKTVHLAAAKAIIDIHQTLLVAGNPLLGLMRQDILAACLSICYNLTIADPATSKNFVAQY